MEKDIALPCSNEIAASLSRTKTQPLPVSALLALAMTGFICIITETLPAGLLPQIAAGLNISNSLAGQTVTAYALGSLLAAIPLTIATQDTAGEGADIALSMNVVAWNGAIAAAGISGGILLDNWGAPALPPALILLLTVAFVITWRARQYGFRKGARMGH